MLISRMTAADLDFWLAVTLYSISQLKEQCGLSFLSYRIARVECTPTCGTDESEFWMAKCNITSQFENALIGQLIELRLDLVNLVESLLEAAG